jgi:hypothetical protein
MRERAIFQKGDLREFLLQRQTQAVQTLMAIPESRFLVDPPAVANTVFLDYTLEDVVIGDRDQVTSKGTRPAKLRAYDHFDERTYEYEGVRVQLQIPFSGPEVVWGYRPSQSYVGGAYGNVQLHSDHFLFVGEAKALTSDQVLAALDQAISELQQTAAWINGEVRVWRQGLQTLLNTAARERRENLAGIAALDEALGIPVHSAAPERQIPIPVSRKPLRPRPPHASGEGTITVTRYLASDVYEDVLRTIEQMTRAMERTPTAAKLGEEELRNLVLTVLNANYEGNVRGEVFNGVGKSDILLSWEGENAFIGECKVWTGPAALRAAIGQLLGYVTWRDTKAALVLFIKSGRATDIIAKAAAEIESHSSYVKSKRSQDDAVRRDFVIRAPSDEQRRIDLALIPVVVMPQTPAKPGA